jgi:hypothetical protein
MQSAQSRSPRYNASRRPDEPINRVKPIETGTLAAAGRDREGEQCTYCAGITESRRSEQAPQDLSISPAKNGGCAEDAVGKVEEGAEELVQGHLHRRVYEDVVTPGHPVSVTRGFVL